MRVLMTLWALAACVFWLAPAMAGEYNPIVRHPVSIGPEAQRLIVGFKATSSNAVTHTISSRLRTRRIQITQAQTSPTDVASLSVRVGVTITGSRQLTPNMHVLFLPTTLYGGAVTNALARLRADPAVEFADVDELRYPLTVPNDPLFGPTNGASGQWYLNTPSSTPVTVEGVQTTDWAATDAVSAWGMTTGSTGIVIADVDTGVRFDHPDLLRAGLTAGARLLPGYDFVSQDYNSQGIALGTYLSANDGDGWDPDPSDPGDWISIADTKNPLFVNCTVASSSWHGTRVVGIFGAITNNDVGIAGMSWGAWVLPVRALGKCGGYDSDIITGIEWAAGMPVTGTGITVPDNPYPADIINMSLGGSTTCPSDYQKALTTVTGLGVLVVASAGNSTTAVTADSSVGAPANCSASVSGMIAVAGLRNVGTKVGLQQPGARGRDRGARWKLHQFQRRLSPVDRHHGQSGDHYSRHQQLHERNQHEPRHEFRSARRFRHRLADAIGQRQSDAGTVGGPAGIECRRVSREHGQYSRVPEPGFGHGRMLVPAIRPMRQRHGQRVSRRASGRAADRGRVSADRDHLFRSGHFRCKRQCRGLSPDPRHVRVDLDRRSHDRVGGQFRAGVDSRREWHGDAHGD